MKARCIAHVGINRIEFRDTQVRDPAEGEITVEACYSCISPGTELRCLRGKQGNSKPFPFVPGYAMVGRVKARGPGVTLPEGTPVLVGGTSQAEGLEIMWGGHISHAVTRAQDAIPIPAGVDLLEAAAAKLAAIAFHGLRSSRPMAGERVAAIGLGIIGQCAARLHRLSGADVVAGDLSASRVETAQRAGLKAVRIEGSLIETFRPHFPDGVDIVVDATGAPAVLPQAVELAHELPWDNSLTPAARYLVQGSYEEGFTVPYQPAFYRELTFLIPRNVQERDCRAVLDLLAAGRLSLKDLVSEVRPPREAPSVYAALLDPRSALLTVAFDWSR